MADSQEKLAIATKFILSSPPGELEVCVRDVKELLADNDLLGSRAEGIFRAYHTDQMIPVVAPGSEYSVLLTKIGEIDATHYVDPSGEQVLTVDHINTACTGTRAFSSAESAKYASPASSALRSSLHDLISGYVKDHFSQGVASVYAVTEGSGFTLHVCIGATKTSPRNFWSGRWRSVWSVAMTKSGGDVELKGTIKVQAHFYEEGNVQLAGETEKTTTIHAGSDPASVAALIAENIAKLENEYQNGLEAVFVNLKAFQSLRRKLPIHAEKFNWDNLQMHRVSKDLAAGGGKK